MLAHEEGAGRQEALPRSFAVNYTGLCRPGLYATGWCCFPGYIVFSLSQPQFPRP